MALVIGTWLWGDKYGPEDVRKLFGGVRRNMRQPFRALLVADRLFEIDGVECVLIPERARHLLTVPGCFARLVAFDPEWQRAVGIDDLYLNLDLDLVVTGRLDPLLDRPEPFCIAQGLNAANPCPYNGSVWMLRAGSRPDVWTGFSMEAARKMPSYGFPDDQGWFHAMMPGAAGWGPADGVYAFQKPGWPKSDQLPPNARIVAFPGWRSPQKFQHRGWIVEHWRA